MNIWKEEEEGRRKNIQSRKEQITCKWREMHEKKEEFYELHFVYASVFEERFWMGNEQEVAANMREEMWGMEVYTKYIELHMARFFGTTSTKKFRFYCC